MPRSSLTRLRLVLRRYSERRRSRRQLLTLDDRLLRDIGMSRAQVTREARTPCWKDSFSQGKLYEKR
ncbi:DUF1127 domain-containing protein [Vreelandella sp. EE22]